MSGSTEVRRLDAVVIGAGFSGLFMNHRLRDSLGLEVQVIEAGGDVGGTWYWNRYPGARCDSEAYVYCFGFDQDLMQDWEWSGKYPEQAEILRYLSHVADRFDLRRNMSLNTRVTSAHFDETTNRWIVETDTGDRYSSRYLITGIGCLSTGQIPEFRGRDSFEGEAYHTGAWPHDGVDFSGKRVAVIGTGSSGVQSIPVIARQADHLTVFQRTPQYMIPARHGNVDKAVLDEIKREYEEIYEKARHSNSGFPYDVTDRSALDFDDSERQEIFEEGWRNGGFRFMFSSFSDLRTSLPVAESAGEFIREKIRQTVKDPARAQKLLPLDHPFGSKRILIDTDYFETYNRDNVDLVDINAEPIVEITESGITAGDTHHPFDIIVYATGFDAMTGSFNRIDIRGRGGRELKAKWAAGPRTYLGLTTAGFPNLFMITGPGSPSVLSNMPVSIEQHVELVTTIMSHLDQNDLELIEAEIDAEDAWVEHVNEVAEPTLYMHADSWYLGANIPGKPRVFMPYAGGVGPYRQICEKVVANGYEGFVLTPRQASPSLSVTYTTTVTPDQIDELGHMNVRWYGHSARAATAALSERLGLGEPIILSAYTRHHHEQLEGAALEVRSAVLGGSTRLRLYHELRNRADNDLAATFVHELDHPWFETPAIDLPEHGRPRTLDLDADRLASAPTLAEVRSRGLAVRLERQVTAEDAHPNDLFWGGERPDEETSWIHETADGDRVASATMESRIWLHGFPALGTRIQSFVANIHVGEKITHELGWVFDLDSEVLVAAFEGVDLSFSISMRKSVVKPPQVRERELELLHPDLA